MTNPPEVEASDAQGDAPPPRYVLTWHLGYRAALDLAESLTSGAKVVLVTLTSQDLPEDDEIERIRRCGFPMVAVSDHFESEQDGLPPSDQFASALEIALREFNEGFGWPPAPPESYVPDAVAEPTTPALTSSADEDSNQDKVEFLRAMYGDGRDDGAR